MAKKLSLLFLIVIFFSGNVFASGDVRPYVGFKGALSFIQSDFDLGYYYDGRYPYCGNYYYDNGYYYYNDCYRNYYDESTDTVFSGSAAFGVKVKNMRFEAEYTYRMPAEQQYRHFSDIRQEFNTVMFNFFYDIPVYPKIYPYGGVGVGGTYVKNEVQYSGTEKKLCFSFAGDLGVSFEVAKHLNLDTGIRVTYLGGMPIEFTDYYMYAIDMYFGLRYMV